jgi:predicted Zn-dependent peptidase
VAEYNKINCENGLTIVSEYIESVRSIALGVWIKAGGRFERNPENGLAHFLEHMMFKGTKKRTPLKIAQSLESVGGNLNAFTAKENTCYFANTLDIHLEKAIELLADMICNSIFPQKEISKEKRVILEEIKSVKDTPEDYIFDLFQERIFPENALGRSILGTEENVLSFDRFNLLNFWQHYYHPKNIVVAVAGNFNQQKLIRFIHKHFNFDISVTETKPVFTNGYARKKTFYIDQPINQAHICMGTGTYIPFTSEERFPLLVLNTYLGGGMSSRLFQVLREKKGLAYSVYSFTDFYHDIGVFGIYAGCDKNKLNDVLETVDAELRSLLARPLSGEKLKRVKNQLKGNVILGLESMSRRMSRLAKNELYFGDYLSIDTLIERIDSVTSDDVSATAQKVIQPEKFINVILKPSL